MLRSRPSERMTGRVGSSPQPYQVLGLYSVAVLLFWSVLITNFANLYFLVRMFRVLFDLTVGSRGVQKGVFCTLESIAINMVLRTLVQRH